MSAGHSTGHLHLYLYSTKYQTTISLAITLILGSALFQDVASLYSKRTHQGKRGTQLLNRDNHNCSRLTLPSYPTPKKDPQIFAINSQKMKLAYILFVILQIYVNLSIAISIYNQPPVPQTLVCRSQNPSYSNGLHNHLRFKSCGRL